MNEAEHSKITGKAAETEANEGAEMDTNLNEAISLAAHAKINLSLDVLRRREDGYHEVKMVMQSLTLCDEIGMSPLPKKDGIVLETWQGEAASLPLDERNLMYRAAKLMRERFSIEAGIRLCFKKNIPVAAGLAGGSADAAAVMLGMNELFGLRAGLSELQELGAALGADIPYCMLGGTALAEGIGEKLTKLPPAPPCQVLLVKPARGVSTKEVYEALRVDERPQNAHPDIDSVISALQDKNIKKLSERMGNILELVTVPMVPEIEKIKDAMRTLGAAGTLMSGSGPTVFGLFTDAKLLSEAEKAFSEGAYRQLAKDVIRTEFYRFTAL